jgi:sodium transport system permease protein
MMPNIDSSRSGLLAIIKKELTRFFTDKRMVLTTILLPGLMIVLLWTFMGNALSSLTTVSEDYVPEAYAVNLPDSVKAMAEQTGLPLTPIVTNEADTVKQQIADKEADLLVVFPEDFDAAVAATLTQETDGGGAVPQVALYYNSTRTESSVQYSTMSTLLDGYKNSLAPLFAVNAGGDDYDLVTDRDQAGFTFASLLPLMIILFLFTGCITIAPESISGEKERGTIATLLVTPLARWELALGKIVSLGFIALLSGLSSFIGVMVSLPSLMASSGSISAAIYGMGDYAMLLAVTLSTVLMFIGIISIISAFARSVKEASTLVTPLMIIVMLVGVTGMFSQGAQTELGFYLVPVYNSVQSLVGVFSFSAAPLAVALTTVTNLVVTGLCILALTKMFNSEKVMFSR